jgi:hypothetical protein
MQAAIVAMTISLSAVGCHYRGCHHMRGGGCYGGGYRGGCYSSCYSGCYGGCYGGMSYGGYGGAYGGYGGPFGGNFGRPFGFGPFARTGAPMGQAMGSAPVYGSSMPMMTSVPAYGTPAPMTSTPWYGGAAPSTYSSAYGPPATGTSAVGPYSGGNLPGMPPGVGAQGVGVPTQGLGGAAGVNPVTGGVNSLVPGGQPSIPVPSVPGRIR